MMLPLLLTSLVLLMPLVAPQKACSSYVLNEIAKAPAPLVNDSYVLRASASGNAVAYVETNADGTSVPRRGMAVILHVNGDEVEVGATYGIVGDIALGRNGTLAAVTFHSNPDEDIVPDYVRVFERNSNDEWVQLGNDIDNILDGVDDFQSLHWNGDTLAIKERSGLIMQYSLVVGVWTQISGIINGDLNFAVDGSVAALGRSTGSDNYKGHGEISRYGTSGWYTQWSTVTDATGHFWIAADTNGDVAVFGFQKQRNELGVQSGVVRVVHFDGAGWDQTSELYPPEGGSTNDRYGSAVSLSSDGEWLVVGAETLDTDSLNANGGIFLYRQRQDRSWALVDLVVGDDDGDWFGGVADLNEDATLMIGGGYGNYVKVFRRECGTTKNVAGSSAVTTSTGLLLGLVLGFLTLS